MTEQFDSILRSRVHAQLDLDLPHFQEMFVELMTR